MRSFSEMRRGSVMWTAAGMNLPFVYFIFHSFGIVYLLQKEDFTIHFDRLTWDEARKTCERETRKLLRVETLKKWNDLTAISEFYKFFNMTACWTGLRTYSVDCTGYTWGGWVNVCLWTNWKPSQPANCRENQCGKIEGGKWVTELCSKQMPFMCETITNGLCPEEQPPGETGEATTGTGDATTGIGEATTETGDATTGTGEATTETGEATTETGEATTGIGEATTGTGEATTETGDATTGIGDATTKTGEATTETGEATTGTEETATILTNTTAELSSGGSNEPFISYTMTEVTHRTDTVPTGSSASLLQNSTSSTVLETPIDGSSNGIETSTVLQTPVDGSSSGIETSTVLQTPVDGSSSGIEASTVLPSSALSVTVGVVETTRIPMQSAISTSQDGVVWFEEHQGKTVIDTGLVSSVARPTALTTTGTVESCKQTCIETEKNSFQCWAVVMLTGSDQCVLYYIDGPSKLRDPSVMVSLAGAVIFLKTQVSTSTREIPCTCALDINWNPPTNVSKEIMLELMEKLMDLKGKLSINKNQTQKYQRTLISAEDKRVSAVGIGSMGVALLVVVFAFVVIADLVHILSFFNIIKAVCKKNVPQP